MYTVCARGRSRVQVRNVIWVNSFGSTQCTLRPNERRTETGLAGRRDTERRGFARKRVEAVPKIGADRNRHSRAPARLPGKAAVECDNVLYEMHAVSRAMASSAKPPSKQPAQLTPQQMIAGIERLKKRLEEVERFDPLSVTDQHNAPNLDALEAAVDETSGSDIWRGYARLRPIQVCKRVRSRPV